MWLRMLCDHYPLVPVILVLNDMWSKLKYKFLKHSDKGFITLTVWTDDPEWLSLFHGFSHSHSVHRADTEHIVLSGQQSWNSVLLNG